MSTKVTLNVEARSSDLVLASISIGPGGEDVAATTAESQAGREGFQASDTNVCAVFEQLFRSLTATTWSNKEQYHLMRQILSLPSACS